MVQQAISTNFKNSYKLIETCYAPETSTVALSTFYSIKLKCKLIKSSCTQRYKNTNIVHGLRPNFKNSYKLIETCYAPETSTVALSTFYSINLGCKLIKS